MNTGIDETWPPFRAYDVSRESQERLKIYADLLTQWQQRINLIGPSTVSSLWKRHILDALQLLPLLPPNVSAIADLGTGAGIPGLVLACAANIEVHLYESNAKKCAFLREAIRRTGARCRIHGVRLENINRTGHIPQVECVVSRALAPLTLLLEYAEPFLGRGSMGLFHKGRDVDLELTEATKYWRFHHTKHPSASDSEGVVLEVTEVRRV